MSTGLRNRTHHKWQMSGSLSSLDELESARKLWHIRSVNVNELKQLLKSSPFRPITVCTGSNKRYSIGHPEFAALSPAGDTLIVFLPNARGHDVVDVPQIERVEERKRSRRRPQR